MEEGTRIGMYLQINSTGFSSVQLKGKNLYERNT